MWPHDPPTARLSRRHALRAGLGVALLPLPAHRAWAEQRFRGREMVSSVFGGPGHDLIQRLVFDHVLRETGARSTQVPLLSAVALARMRAEAQAPQIDLFTFAGGQERPAKAGGLTQPIPTGSHFHDVPPQLKDPDGHWIAWGLVTEGILYRTDKLREPPRSYRDFFRPELEGHIAFPHISNAYGTDFLVMLARTFGGDEQNMDPGFVALRRLAARSTIFRTAAEVQTLFAAGDIWIMPYDGASAMRCSAAGLPVAYSVPEEGAPSVMIVGCIARRSTNADVAGVILDRHLAPEVQVELARGIGWAPVNRASELSPDIAAFMAPANRLAHLDRDLINASRSNWTERFNREISAR